MLGCLAASFCSGLQQAGDTAGKTPRSVRGHTTRARAEILTPVIHLLCYRCCLFFFVFYPLQERLTSSCRPLGELLLFP